LFRHTVAILRAFGLLQATERVSVTLWLPLRGLDDNGRPVFLAIRASEQAVLCSVLSGWNVTSQFACDSFFLELLEESLALLARSGVCVRMCLYFVYTHQHPETHGPAEPFRRLGASLRSEPNQLLSPAPVVVSICCGTNVCTHTHTHTHVHTYIHTHTHMRTVCSDTAGGSPAAHTCITPVAATTTEPAYELTCAHARAGHASNA
jgi:hypothetical protein